MIELYNFKIELISYEKIANEFQNYFKHMHKTTKKLFSIKSSIF